MARGLPYDSDAGRDYAGAITALMSGASYLQSTRIAAVRGPFEGFEANREPMLQVMRNHRAALRDINSAHVPLALLQAAKMSWEGVVEEGERHGIRNSQISVLAPTGTIAFMMDCDTTGVEPDIALVKYKEARRRRDDQDRQPDRSLGAGTPWGTTRRRRGRSSSTSTRSARSRVRLISPTNTCRSSTAPSSRPRVRGRSITWDISACWRRYNRSFRARSARRSTCPKSQRRRRSRKRTSRAGSWGSRRWRSTGMAASVLSRCRRGDGADCRRRPAGGRPRARRGRHQSPSAPRRTPSDHAQVLDQRRRRVHYGRPVRRRPAAARSSC